MPERPNPSVQLPGYSAPWDIPGQAKKLAARAAAGRGEMGAEQAAANRVFRTREADAFTAPLPRRVETVADVTAGLGLDRATETRVQKMVEGQRADFTKKGQTQRSFLARNALVESLRRIRDVPSDARMEITKRASAFWRATQPTDYATAPVVRAPKGTQMRSDTTIKSESGVRFVVRRDVLMKAPKGGPVKPMPPGLNATGGEHMGAGPAQPPPPAPAPAPAAGAAPAAGGANAHAPAGFAPIPNSSKGGFRKKQGDGWVYWYPGAGITSTPHPADRGQARAKRSAEASGPVPKKGAPPPAAGGVASATPPHPGAGAPPQAGAQPPPLPGKGPPKPGAPPPVAGAPASAGGQGAAPPTLAGAAPPPQAGGAPAAAAPPPGPQGGAAPQQGPHKSSEQPQVTKDHTGEKRQFHPLVTAHTPAGKENDFQHHAGEFQRHRAEKKAAMRAGDAEKAKAHTYAMNFHADKHNKLLAAAQGRQYTPKGNYPGADQGDAAGGADDGSSTIASQYDRAGKPGKGGEQSAADPRERFVPESAAVKGMRQRIGKAVSIMADLSQAHDHLSSLKAKRMEAKRSGHPLARRMVSQIDAEIAATKHDIVQLEDAHGHAMKEVLAHQSQLRNEKIRSNPIFQAFMNAMQSLSGLAQRTGAALGEKAGEALEGAKGAVEDFKNRGAKAKQDAQRAGFDQALGAAGAKDASPESGEVKPLGVSKEDIAARFGDPDAEAAGAERNAAAMDTLKKLGAMQGEEPAAEGGEASPDDVEALPDEEDGEEAGAAPEGAGESEAASALKDIFGMQAQREQMGAARKQRAEESAGFDRELASARNKRDMVERRAAAQAEMFAQRNAGRSDRSVMREQLGDTGEVDGHASTQSGGTVASGVRKKGAPEQGTVATGAKKKQRIAVEKSMRLVKSHAWARVMRLAPKLDDTLRKSVPVFYVAPFHHIARAPMSFLDLYG